MLFVLTQSILDSFLCALRMTRQPGSSSRSCGKGYVIVQLFSLDTCVVLCLSTAEATGWTTMVDPHLGLFPLKNKYKCVDISPYSYLVGGLEHEFYFSIYLECHHPNWRTPSFFRAQPSTSYNKLLTLPHIRVAPSISRMLNVPHAPQIVHPSRALRKRSASLEFLDPAVLWSLPILRWGQCLAEITFGVFKTRMLLLWWITLWLWQT